MKSRNTLIALLLGLLFLPNVSKSQAKEDQYLIIGTYTRTTSEGIYVYKFNTNTGSFSAVSIAKGIKNPSFLTVSPNQKFIYSVGETDSDGSVSAFSFDKKSGNLTKLNTQSSGGANPCHLSIDKTGKWILVGNYSGGNLSVLPVEADGLLGKPTQTIQHEGKGTNEARQEKAHVHSVNIAPNNIDVFVPDLGIDKVVTYSLDAKTGKLSEGNPAFTKVADGSGPRHFTIHPNGKFAYVIQELSSTVTAFNYNKGSLSAFQTISTLPKDSKENNACADIHISPDGKFLYGTNRFFNAIVTYSIDPKTGKLTYIENVPVLGEIPRNFMITPNGKYVLVANQKTDNITIFKRDTKTGKLTSTEKQISVPMPVCLKMVSVE